MKEPSWEFWTFIGGVIGLAGLVATIAYLIDRSFFKLIVSDGSLAFLFVCFVVGALACLMCAVAISMGQNGRRLTNLSDNSQRNLLKSRLLVLLTAVVGAVICVTATALPAGYNLLVPFIIFPLGVYATVTAIRRCPAQRAGPS